MNFQYHYTTCVRCFGSYKRKRQEKPEEYSRSKTHHRLCATRNVYHAPAARWEDLTSITKPNRSSDSTSWMNQESVQCVLALFKHTMFCYQIVLKLLKPSTHRQGIIKFCKINFGSSLGMEGCFLINLIQRNLISLPQLWILTFLNQNTIFSFILYILKLLLETKYQITMITDHFNNYTPENKDNLTAHPLDSTAITMVVHLCFKNSLLTAFCHLPFFTLNTVWRPHSKSL